MRQLQYFGNLWPNFFLIFTLSAAQSTLRKRVYYLAEITVDPWSWFGLYFSNKTIIQILPYLIVIFFIHFDCLRTIWAFVVHTPTFYNISHHGRWLNVFLKARFSLCLDGRTENMALKWFVTFAKASICSCSLCTKGPLTWIKATVKLSCGKRKGNTLKCHKHNCCFAHHQYDPLQQT